MIRILMVCLGNICRSPLAEGILTSKLNPKEFQIDSCGTSNYHIGKKPDTRSIDIARKHGIDITNQRASQFTVGNFDTYDFIYPMDSANYNDIIKLARNENDRKKVKLILEELNLPTGIDVPDPYYGGDQGFMGVYKMLDEACTKIAEKL
ncbi:low molecular weight protein-tyrosine-phosphatase [Aquimarina addita]|uniref:protein-tyrosine-phosphatase n=1 Tax=Aquimarina addita TaxID=870485 RepID=A0ABP6UQ60_9FLAO